MWRACFLLAVAAACPLFTCNETESMQCVEQTEEGFVYRECPDGYFCPPVAFEAMKPTSCQPIRVAGTETSESTCLHYLGEGEDCTEGFCGRLLYCAASQDGSPKCTPAKRLGQQCTSNSQCREETVCSGGRCIQIFSLAEGAAADTRVACKSARLKDGICLAESLTVGDRPKPCASDEDCASSSGEAGECVCAGNADGQAYCTLHDSDEPVKKYLEAVSNVEIEEAAARAYKIVYYPLIKGTHDCWDDVIEEVVEFERRDDVYEKCSGALLLLILSPLLA